MSSSPSALLMIQLAIMILDDQLSFRKNDFLRPASLYCTSHLLPFSMAQLEHLMKLLNRCRFFGMKVLIYFLFEMLGVSLVATSNDSIGTPDEVVARCRFFYGKVPISFSFKMIGVSLVATAFGFEFKLPVRTSGPTFSIATASTEIPTNSAFSYPTILAS